LELQVLELHVEHVVLDVIALDVIALDVIEEAGDLGLLHWLLQRASPTAFLPLHLRSKFFPTTGPHGESIPKLAEPEERA
jgi:hypothetical protein